MISERWIRTGYWTEMQGRRELHLYGCVGNACPGAEPAALAIGRGTRGRDRSLRVCHRKRGSGPLPVAHRWHGGIPMDVPPGTRNHHHNAIILLLLMAALLPLNLRPGRGNRRTRPGADGSGQAPWGRRRRRTESNCPPRAHRVGGRDEWGLYHRSHHQGDMAVAGAGASSSASWSNRSASDASPGSGSAQQGWTNRRPSARLDARSRHRADDANLP